jgi:hypothetical protein
MAEDRGGTVKLDQEERGREREKGRERANRYSRTSNEQRTCKAVHAFVVAYVITSSRHRSQGSIPQVATAIPKAEKRQNRMWVIDLPLLRPAWTK